MLYNRLKLFAAIEATRRRPLIVIATNNRTRMQGYMTSDMAPEVARQIRLIDPCSEIDALLITSGGFVGASERIVGLLQERCGDFNVLLPAAALSCATETALAAREIVMTPSAALGPIDAGIGETFAAGVHHLGRFLDREQVPPAERAKFFASLGDGATIGDLGDLERATAGGHAWALRQLSRRMSHADAERIIERLTYGYSTHHTWIMRSEARDMGLPVTFAGERLERLMTAVADDFRREFNEREQFVPLGATFDSPEACRANMPAGIPVSKPTPVTNKCAVVESIRHASIEIQDWMVYVQQEAGAPKAKPALLRSRWEDVSFKLPPMPAFLGKQPTGECHV